MIDFADPLFLALAPLPLLLARRLPPTRQRGGALVVPEGVARHLAAGASAQGKLWRRSWLPFLVWICLLLALSGPRQLSPVAALKVSGRDLAIAIDLSGSMVRDDFDLDGERITRLDAVKRVGADFVRRRAGDRVALIVFGSDAYYAAPFSFDTEAVARRIEEATIGISGRATNISDALGLALKRLEDSQAATRVVILLSDGVNNAGATNPRGVARLAADLGVRVHTIALGPRDLDTAEPGERGVVDAATLAVISDLSGGETFRVRTTGDLVAVADALDRLEATEGDGLAAEVFRDFWVWFAAAAAALSLLAARRQVE